MSGRFLNHMKKSINNLYKYIFAAITVLAPIVYILANIGRTSGLFFPPDEIGYWENVARMRGFDWSGSTFMQSYYAKGYSVLLYPLTFIFKSPLMMYNGALFINAVLFGLGGLALYAYIKELSGNLSEFDTCLIALTATFYPAHFVYMNYTIAESLLYLLVTVVFCMLAKYEKYGKTVDALIAVVVCVAMVFTHFRTVGVAVAAGVMIFAVWQKNHGRTIPWRKIALAVGVLLVISIVISISPIRSSYSYLDDKLDRLGRVFTLNGLISVIMGTMGKLFYICVATFGILCNCVKWIWQRRKTCYTGSTLLVSLLVSAVIASVFFVGGKGIDYLVYGRYTEIFAPLIICVGFCGIFETDKPDKKMGIICSALTAVLAIVLVVYAIICGINMYKRDFIIGLSWVFGRKMPLINELIGIPALICIVVMWAIILFMRSGAQIFKARIASAVIAGVFMFIGIYMSEVCVYHYHELDRADVELFDTVTDMYDTGRKVSFLRPPGVNYIGHLQFYMFERTIDYIDGPDPEAFSTGPTDIVITYDNYENRDMLSEKYDSMEESPHFVMYYNE